ncbi:MAG: hypothetical protein ABI273_00090 [Lacunisphaera sp.]
MQETKSPEIPPNYLAWIALQSHSLSSFILCHAAVNGSYHFVSRQFFWSTPIATPKDMIQPLPLLMLTVSFLVSVLGDRILHGEFTRGSLAIAV